MPSDPEKALTGIPSDPASPLLLNPSDLKVKNNLGAIKIDHLISQGRFGQIYKAKMGERTVAVKAFGMEQRKYFEKERDVYQMVEGVDKESKCLMECLGVGSDVILDGISMVRWKNMRVLSRVSQKNMKIQKVDLHRLFRVSYDPISLCMAKLN